MLIYSGQTLDLTAPPYDRRRATWVDPNDYAPCQDFAEGARALATQAIRYESARDPAAHANLAVFDPLTVDGRSLEIARSWHLRFEGSNLTAYAAFPSAKHLKFTFEQFGFEGR